VRQKSQLSIFNIFLYIGDSGSGSSSNRKTFFLGFSWAFFTDGEPIGKAFCSNIQYTNCILLRTRPCKQTMMSDVSVLPRIDFTSKQRVIEVLNNKGRDYILIGKGRFLFSPIIVQHWCQPTFPGESHVTSRFRHVLLVRVLLLALACANDKRKDKEQCCQI